ncbi:MAG: phage tail protein [Bradyrhizobium sp.]|uniref:phage tail protein n=1 Tax=Bradyrhizobium sp. TaxID=376 RepID=UPI003D0C67F3
MAFGRASFGDAAFGDASLRPAGFVMFVVASMEINFSYRIHVATEELITVPGDSPANQQFLGSLDQALRFRRSIVQQDGFGGFIVGQGELVIQNADGAFDDLPLRYALDGRDVEVRHGRKTDRYDDMLVVFKGVAADGHVDEAALTVPLQDYSFRLEAPLNANRYGGTGGADGGEDLAGKRKPRALGYVQNVAPPLVVPNLLIHQVNDGPVEAIEAVYVRGVALNAGADHADYAALAAASVSSGDFHTCLAEGFFRVNFVLEGEVTADVEGDASGDGYVETRAGLVKRVLELATEVPTDATGLYLPAFAAFEASDPNAVGWWADHNDNSNVADAIANLIGPAAWAGFRRDGRFEAMRFDLPSGPPHWRCDKTLIRNIKRERLPDGLAPPPWRWRVPWGRNWTVIADPAGSVSEARRAFLAEEVRYANAEAAAVKVDHPLALERTVTGAAYVSQAAAEAEAERLLALHRKSAALYRLTFDLRPLTLDVGDVIEGTYPRWDLRDGRMLRVVEVGEDARAGEIEIVGFG